jgi:prepilin-type N-terminal cleavage/methylation domain-containing protein
LKHPGFTLMELLIVLAIIVMVMSIGTPSVVKILDRSKFRDGVLSLQTELGRTRIQAMKNGITLVFRYRVGTGEYKIYPQVNVSGSIFDETVPVPIRLLPEPTLFMGGTTIEAESFQNAPREDSQNEGGEAVGSLNSLPTANSFTVAIPAFSQTEADGGWSKPIIFFPNGRTSTAVIFLCSRPERGKQDYYSEISFRGMTGSARVSSISVFPPGSPEFPSVLSDRAFARLWGNNAPHAPERSVRP